MEAYIHDNTPELRSWLLEQGLTPVAYPDSARPGLTAPYPNVFGERIKYNDGLRYDTDDDADDFVICNSEEEFKQLVLELIEK